MGGHEEGREGKKREREGVRAKGGIRKEKGKGGMENRGKVALWA